MNFKKILLIVFTLLVFYILSPMAISFFYYQDMSKKENKNMIVIAHRGGASLAPENTLACFKKGMECGADMIELDIHLTKDNELVVCHDQTLDRTTTGKGKIRDHTLEEIRQLSIIDANGNITEEKVPTLQEVFSLAKEWREDRAPVKLLVEIKRTKNIYQGIEEKLADLIRLYNATDWVTVQSFNDFAIEKIHRLIPQVKVEKLAFYKFPFIPFIVDGFHISYFSYKKYQYVNSFNYYYRMVTPSLIKDIHNHGHEIKIWTLEGDNPGIDADGLITNRPDLLR